MNELNRMYDLFDALGQNDLSASGRQALEALVKKYPKEASVCTPAFPPALPEGWTESVPGCMATSRDPLNGGIVDSEMVSGEWFVIFNRVGIEPLDGFATRAEAFQAMRETLAKV